VLPTLEGAPIRVTVRTSLGHHLAAASIPKRFILLDREVLAVPGDFERVLVHELFHFVWVRLSNAARREWEVLLETELANGVDGELGWSAACRKQKLTRRDARIRTVAWRHYCCESFCDSAARAFAGLTRHDEFTLPSPQVRRRLRWLQNLATNGLRL
jgi:hypothetical protein